ncbi:MAG: helix-turn-helix domain-containing protein [Bacteroidia bacterium]
MANILVNMLQFSLSKKPIDYQIELSQKLKKIRKEKGYSQAELSKRSGVSLGSLKRFESSGQISLESLLMLAEILGRIEDFDQLFNINEDLKIVAKLFSEK